MPSQYSLQTPLNKVTTGYEWKGSTINHASVAMTATEAVIKAANTSRASIVIQNVGTKEVSIGITGQSFGDGPILKPASAANAGDGGSITIDNTTGAIYGICDSGQTSTVVYLEEEA